MAASCKHHLNGKTSTTELLRRLEVAPSCSEPKDNSTRLEPDIALIHDKYVYTSHSNTYPMIQRNWG